MDRHNCGSGNSHSPHVTPDQAAAIVTAGVRVDITPVTLELLGMISWITPCEINSERGYALAAVQNLIKELQVKLMLTWEVARVFGVDNRTVREWAIAGKLSPARTLGGDKRAGDRRYRALEVCALIKYN